MAKSGKRQDKLLRYHLKVHLDDYDRVVPLPANKYEEGEGRPHYIEFGIDPSGNYYTQSSTLTEDEIRFCLRLTRKSLDYVQGQYGIGKSQDEDSNQVPRLGYDQYHIQPTEVELRESYSVPEEKMQAMLEERRVYVATLKLATQVIDGILVQPPTNVGVSTEPAP